VDLCAHIGKTETPNRQKPHGVRAGFSPAETVSCLPVHGKSVQTGDRQGGREVTNTVTRWRAKDRRRERGWRPEHDFSVTGLGLAVLAVVVAVMFSV
jgi:hypothetical protein